MQTAGEDIRDFLTPENLIPLYGLDPDEDLYRISLNVETNENVVEYNINAIHAYVVRNFPEVSEDSSEYDKCLETTLGMILLHVRDMLKNRDINSWGNVYERYENVHDSSVNISLRNAYAQIKVCNEKNNWPVYIQNIRSYYNICEMNYRISLSQIVSMINNIGAFLESDEIIDEYFPEGYEYADYLRDILHVINYCIDSVKIIKQKMETLAKVRHVIEYIYKTRQFITCVGDNEFNVMCEVWRRIHALYAPAHSGEKIDAHDEQDVAQLQKQGLILDMFSSELATVYNEDKPDKVECVSGRVAALIGCLETFDENVKIDCVPALKIHMIQNRAPRLIDSAVEIYKSRGTEEAAQVEQYDSGEPASEVVHFVRNYVSAELYKEFSHNLSTYHYDLFLGEILGEI